MKLFEGYIAWRYLWSSRREGFITLITALSFLGICLSVGTLIVVMSVMNGFRYELSQKILDFNSHLSLFDPEQEFKDYKDILSKIKNIRGVVTAIPLVEGQAMLSAKGQSLGVMARGMPYEDLITREVLFKNNFEGDLTDFREAEPVLAIGSRLREKLRVNVGEPVTLISPEGNVTPFGTMPRVQTFRVAAIFQSGMYEYDVGFVFLPFKVAQNFFQTNKSIHHMEIFLTNPYNPDAIAYKIQELIPRPFKFLGWHQAHASFFEVIRIERNVMFVILSLIILIAALNIVSGLVMLVKDKTQDIAILKTMGVSSKSILRIFVMVGGAIGTLGTLGGVLLGLLVSYNLESIRQFLQNLTGTRLFDAEFYFLSQLPVKVELVDVMTTAFMALVLAFLATIYPAWRAARLNPVEALRYE